MTKAITGVTGLMAAAFAAAALAGPATAAKAKMVTIYQADKCHMYYSPAQARLDNYVCPDSKGKMHKMMVTSEFAAKALHKASKANGAMM